MGKPDALGLSIGYDVIQREFKNGIRYLKELKLWEWSLVTIPCNELATPTGVKSMTLKERLNKKSTDALTMQQALSVDDLMRMRWDIEDAFCDVRWNLQDNDASLDDATRINLMDQALSDYHTLMLDWFKRYIALTSTITAQNESVTMDVALTKALSAVREAKKLPETVRALNALLETSEPGSPTQGDSEPQADGLKELGEALTNLETEVTKIGPRT
jgi:hypothetical protein